MIVYVNKILAHILISVCASSTFLLVHRYTQDKIPDYVEGHKVNVFPPNSKSRGVTTKFLMCNPRNFLCLCQKYAYDILHMLP